MSLKLNYSTSAFRVCVDDLNDHFLSGRIASQRLTELIPFSDANHLISQLDAAMDTQQFPKAFQKLRTFSDSNTPEFPQDIPVAMSADEMMPEEHISTLHGKKATFLLCITMRRNASWQGVVDWLDGSPRQTFSSTLEFLNSLDQHLIIWAAASQSPSK